MQAWSVTEKKRPKKKSQKTERGGRKEEKKDEWRKHRNLLFVRVWWTLDPLTLTTDSRFGFQIPDSRFVIVIRDCDLRTAQVAQLPSTLVPWQGEPIRLLP